MVDSSRYASIENVFKRNHDTGEILPGQFSVSEFEYLQTCKWTFTEKMDGMNIRIIIEDGVEFRGRSDAVILPTSLVKHLRNTFDTESIGDKSAVYGEGLCLYGEGVGAGIQRGAKYGFFQFFTLFDVMTSYGWASRRDVVDTATCFHVPVVPVVLEGTLADAIQLVTEGLESSHGNFFAEGLVGRPEPELLNRYGDRITCKIKHRDFFQEKRGLA